MTEEYLGVITNYRIGPKSQRSRECLIKVLGVEQERVPRLVGWKVGWPHEDVKIKGLISRTHGRTGILRAKFKRGLPGQALGSKVRIARE